MPTSKKREKNQRAFEKMNESSKGNASKGESRDYLKKKDNSGKKENRNFKKKSKESYSKESYGKDSYSKDSYKKDEKPVREVVRKKITKGCLVCQECGQCSGQQETYRDHVAAKQKRLQEILEPFVKPQEMIAMDKADHYKCRVHRMFHHERNGTPMSGHFSVEERRIVKIEECYIDDRKCQEIINTIKGMLKSFKIKTYDVKSGHGLLRYVAVRRGMETNEIMVTLVLSSIIMPSKNNFVKELRRLHPEITTILISENYKDIDNVYGDKEVNLYGKGFIWDRMCGRDFRIGAKSQFTLNPRQTKKICDVITEWGAFDGTELVLDAFCGVGTYGIVLSDKVRKVLSVETNNEMHRDTISNIRRNGIKNIDVYKNNPAEFVMQVAKSEKEDIEVAIVTQPYSGCGKEFTDAIGKARPKKVFLITRNLKSMKEELTALTKSGYRVSKAVGVDIHPWTERIDSVVLLTRR